MADGLVHVAVKIGTWKILGIGRVDGREYGRWEQVCKRNDAII